MIVTVEDEEARPQFHHDRCVQVTTSSVPVVCKIKKKKHYRYGTGNNVIVIILNVGFELPTASSDYNDDYDKIIDGDYRYGTCEIRLLRTISKYHAEYRYRQ